jgi:hypothetical protein
MLPPLLKYPESACVQSAAASDPVAPLVPVPVEHGLLAGPVVPLMGPPRQKVLTRQG